MEEVQGGSCLNTVSKESRKKMGPLPLGMFLSFNERDVHPHCHNGSNPRHKCDRHCLDKIPSGKNKYLDAIRTDGKYMELEKMAERKGDFRNCPNASNPYHKCAENCFEKLSVKVHNFGGEPVHDKGMKKVRRKGLTPTSLKTINSFNKFAGNFFCINSVGYQGRPKGFSIITNQNIVHPMCKYAANPYHKCAEYCFEDTSEKEQIKGVTKSKESKKSPRNHLLMESVGVDSNCTKVSNSGSANVESYQGIILPEDTEKSSIKSKFVESSSPEYNHVEFSEGITIENENNGLHSVTKNVEMKNQKEHSDVQPLHLDASDLFIEWAKYCSQEKTDVYKIAMQDKTAERRDFARRNVRDDADLKCYDSSNFGKDKAKGSLQFFLPSALLFLIGIFFTLLYRTQMIHSSVISERKNSERVISQSCVEPKFNNDI